MDRKLIVKKNDLLVYCAVIVWCASSFLSISTILAGSTALKSAIIHICKYFIIAPLIFKVLFIDKYSINRLVVYAGLFAVFGITTILTGDTDNLLWILLLSVSMRKVSFDNIMRLINVLYICFLGLIIALALMGVIENTVVITTNALTGGIMERHLLGFKHVNFLGGVVFVIFASTCYLKYEKFHLKEVILSVIASAWLFYYVGSKTSSLLIILSLILVLVFKLFSSGKIGLFGIKIISYVTCIVSMVSSIVLSVFYNKLPKFVEVIDYLLTYRLKWGNYFYENYGISLLGQRIEFISTTQAESLGIKSAILDNSYMHLLVHYGIIVFAIVIILYFLMVKYSLDLGKYKICMLVSIIFVCGITEKWMFTPFYNYLLLAFIPLYEEYHTISKDLQYSYNRRK